MSKILRYNVDYYFLLTFWHYIVHSTLSIRLLERMSEMLDMLLAHSTITISDEIVEDQEKFDEPPYRVRGCVLTALERLDDEFTKLLKECDPHSNEYVER